MTSLREWRVELAIVVALLLASGAWATHFWNRWTARGGQPVFYQTYFEPAVMIACGRGFVISRHQPKPLEDFLFLRTDTFNCADLPEHLELDPDHVYQAAWLYLETTVGWAWRVLGISWSGMGPLFGLLFGMEIALAYAICRLCASRPWALFAAASLAMSGTQLVNLPHLRDYAKAPFTLALVLIIGLTVTRPVRRRTLLLLAAAYGAVLGIGYGFRTDFLADLPIMIVVLFAFLEGGVARHLTLKAAAAFVLVATFFVVSWPISSAVYTKGGCQWHVALLGLQPNSNVDLRLAPAPYEFGQAYSDGYIDRVVNGYARRMQPDRPPMVFCSHDYDVQSGRYLREIATTFPADMAIRAYASMIQIVELPFRRWTSLPMEGWFPRLYHARAFLIRPGDHWGTYDHRRGGAERQRREPPSGSVPGFFPRVFRRLSRHPVSGAPLLSSGVHGVVGGRVRRALSVDGGVVAEGRAAGREAAGTPRDDGWRRRHLSGRAVRRRAPIGALVPGALGAAAVRSLHRRAEDGPAGSRRSAGRTSRRSPGRSSSKWT